MRDSWPEAEFECNSCCLLPEHSAEALMYFRSEKIPRAQLRMCRLLSADWNPSGRMASVPACTDSADPEEILRKSFQNLLLVCVGSSDPRDGQTTKILAELLKDPALFSVKFTTVEPQKVPQLAENYQVVSVPAFILVRKNTAADLDKAVHCDGLASAQQNPGQTKPVNAENGFSRREPSPRRSVVRMYEPPHRRLRGASRESGSLVGENDLPTGDATAQMYVEHDSRTPTPMAQEATHQVQLGTKRARSSKGPAEARAAVHRPVQISPGFPSDNWPSDGSKNGNLTSDVDTESMHSGRCSRTERVKFGGHSQPIQLPRTRESSPNEYKTDGWDDRNGGHPYGQRNEKPRQRTVPVTPAEPDEAVPNAQSPPPPVPINVPASVDADKNELRARMWIENKPEEEGLVGDTPFQGLKLRPELTDTLIIDCTHSMASKLQSQMVYEIQKKRRVVVEAPSHSGKCTAYATAIINGLDDKLPKTEAVVVTGSDEHTQRVCDNFIRIGKGSSIRVLRCLDSGVMPMRTTSFSRDQVYQILVGTARVVSNAISNIAIDVQKVSTVVYDDVPDFGVSADIYELSNVLPRTTLDVLIMREIEPKVLEELLESLVELQLREILRVHVFKGPSKR